MEAELNNLRTELSERLQAIVNRLVSKKVHCNITLNLSGIKGIGITKICDKFIVFAQIGNQKKDVTTLSSQEKVIVAQHLGILVREVERTEVELKTEIENALEKLKVL